MIVLVTGGAGFIGSNFIRQELGRSDADEIRILNLDALTYAGNLDNLTDVASDPRYRFLRGDISRSEDVECALADARAAFGGTVSAVVNFAAESHVDRSIEDAGLFLRTNVLGTQVLLDTSRRHGVHRFVQVSTDEVYGSLEPSDPPSTETAPLLPNSPYAASKAAADLVVRSYARTYGLDAVITRASNTYGPFQFPEKLIPLTLSNAVRDRAVPIYGDGLQIRDWLSVHDHCRGIGMALRHGRGGEVYNLGTGRGCTNLELVRLILSAVGKPPTLLEFVAERPGHDRRYALNASKAGRELGWSPTTPLNHGLQQTVDWYLAHQDWVSAARSGAYLRYYEAMYSHRAEWILRVTGSVSAAAASKPGTTKCATLQMDEGGHRRNGS